MSRLLGKNVFGYAPSELEGRSILGILSPADHEPFMQTTRALLAMAAGTVGMALPPQSVRALHRAFSRYLEPHAPASYNPMPRYLSPHAPLSIAPCPAIYRPMPRYLSPQVRALHRVFFVREGQTFEVMVDSIITAKQPDRRAPSLPPSSPMQHSTLSSPLRAPRRRGLAHPTTPTRLVQYTPSLPPHVSAVCVRQDGWRGRYDHVVALRPPVSWRRRRCLSRLPRARRPMRGHPAPPAPKVATLGQCLGQSI